MLKIRAGAGKRKIILTVKESWLRMLNNRASDCWTIEQMTFWAIVQVAIEVSCQQLLCQWLLKNHARDCRGITSMILEKSCQWLLSSFASNWQNLCLRRLNKPCDCKTTFLWLLMITLATIAPTNRLTGSPLDTIFPFIFALEKSSTVILDKYFDQYQISQFRITVNVAFRTILYPRTIKSIFGLAQWMLTLLYNY